MLLPATTGSGASVFEMVRVGAEDTVVVSFGPVCGNASLLSMVHLVLVITVPLASVLFPGTPRCTDPEDPAFTAPTFQVTIPAASVPPAVAETKAVLAGRLSLMTTPVALLVPTFW